MWSNKTWTAQACVRAGLWSVRSLPNPTSEDRRPKEIRDPKSRIHSHASGAVAHRVAPFSDFGFRPSFGFRVSAFGSQLCRPCSPFKRPDPQAALRLCQREPRRHPASTPRAPPDWLWDSGGAAPLALVPGLGADPLLIPHPVADLARIAQDGVMLPLRAAARASALGDLLLLPPVLAGRLHLRLGSPTLPLLSRVKCQAHRSHGRPTPLPAPYRLPPPGFSRRRAAAIPVGRFARGIKCPGAEAAREALQDAPPVAWRCLFVGYQVAITWLCTPSVHHPYTIRTPSAQDTYTMSMRNALACATCETGLSHGGATGRRPSRKER